MRIRTFTADTTPAAMAMVRQEMGPDAVIIAVDQAANGHGVVVRAAFDQGDDPSCQAEGQAAAASLETRLEAFLRERLRPAFRTAHNSAA